jgi:hypothetical protein
MRRSPVQHSGNYAFSSIALARDDNYRSGLHGRADRHPIGVGGSRVNELQQRAVDLRGVRPRDRVRATLDDDELRFLEQRGHALAELRSSP